MARYTPPPVPAGVSPEIAGIWTEYFQAFEKTGSAGTSDDDRDILVKEMDVAALRLAVTPCQTLYDIAAKAQLVIYAQTVIAGLTRAEKAVRASVLNAVVAMATGEDRPLGGDAAPHGVNQPPLAVHG